MKNILSKIINFLSVLVSVLFLYEFIKETIDGNVLVHFDVIPIIITLFVLINLIISLINIFKNNSEFSWIMIFQVIVIIVTIWSLYQIYFPEIIFIDQFLIKQKI